MPRRRGNAGTPRGSIYIDGNLIHTATHKKLFYQTHLCTVYRENLKPTEEFSRINATRAMDKHLRKRQAHGTGSILEDRLTIDKEKGFREPFRPYVYFREIVDVQRSHVKPEFFVLSVDSELSGYKYYEVYKCKNKDDAYKMEHYIKRAIEDPHKCLRDGPVLDVVSIAENTGARRSLANIDYQTSLESLEDNEIHTNNEDQNSLSTQRNDYTMTSDPSPVTVVKEIVLRQSESPMYRRRTSSPEVIRKSRSETTYISFEGRSRAPVVSMEGPVYMYCTSKKPSVGNSERDTRKLTLIYDSSNYNDFRTVDSR